MEHRGMVHALQEIRRLLKPRGILIDIHPVPVAPLYEVHAEGGVRFAAAVPGYDGDEDVVQADKAVVRSLKRRVFVLEDRREFDFLTYGSTVKELLDFVEESSAFHQAEGTEDEPLSSEEEAFFDRLEESHRSAGAGAEVAVRERGRASRLRPAR
jgi:SAM-dependent methyltransferase